MSYFPLNQDCNKRTYNRNLHISSLNNPPFTGSWPETPSPGFAKHRMKRLLIACCNCEISFISYHRAHPWTALFLQSLTWNSIQKGSLYDTNPNNAQEMPQKITIHLHSLNPEKNWVILWSLPSQQSAACGPSTLPNSSVLASRSYLKLTGSP